MRRRERRNLILDVAKQSFFENGYAGTTMSAVANTLGGSKGTLWSYFPSKEILFAAVLDRSTIEFQQELSAALDFRKGALIALESFCKHLLVRLTSPDAIALYRLVMGETQRFPEVGRIFFERGPGRTCDLLAEHIRRAMECGVFRHDDPTIAATHLIGLCLYGCHFQLLTGVLAQVSPDQIDNEVRQALAVFTEAYAAR